MRELTVNVKSVSVLQIQKSGKQEGVGLQSLFLDHILQLCQVLAIRAYFEYLFDVSCETSSQAA
jgi:hypothetical protein